MALDSALVKEVNERLFAPLADAHENPKKTDVAIVFGGRSTSGTVARTASALYKDGHFDRIIVAGGARIFQPEVALALALDGSREILKPGTLRDIFTMATEADYMQQVLLENDVPEHAITIGSREKHADRIVKDLLKNDFDSATLISYAPYAARLLGTSRHQSEERPLVSYPVNVFGLDPQNWQNSKLAPLVANEARNMDPANPKGYIGKYCVVPDWESERRKNATLPNVLP